MKKFILVTVSSFLAGLVTMWLVSSQILLQFLPIPKSMGEGALIPVIFATYVFLILIPILFLIGIFKFTNSWKLTVYSALLITFFIGLIMQKNQRDSEKIIQEENVKFHEIIKQNRTTPSPELIK